jgi:hypothetical protein
MRQLYSREQQPLIGSVLCWLVWMRCVNLPHWYADAGIKNLCCPKGKRSPYTWRRVFRIEFRAQTNFLSTTTMQISSAVAACELLQTWSSFPCTTVTQITCSAVAACELLQTWSSFPCTTVTQMTCSAVAASQFLQTWSQLPLHYSHN